MNARFRSETQAFSEASEFDAILNVPGIVDRSTLHAKDRTGLGLRNGPTCRLRQVPQRENEPLKAARIL
jgi:hypothetical protein